MTSSNVNFLIAESRIAAALPRAAASPALAAATQSSITVTHHEQPKLAKSVEFVDEPEIITSFESQPWRYSLKSNPLSLTEEDNRGASALVKNVEPVTRHFTVKLSSRTQGDVLNFVSVNSVVNSKVPVTPTLTKRTDESNIHLSKTQRRPVSRNKQVVTKKQIRVRSADGRLSLTTVQPFNFSLRQWKAYKSRTLEEYEWELREKRRAEEAEIAKCSLFRATRPPPSTYLPFYDELVRQKRPRSAESRIFSKQMLSLMKSNDDDKVRRSADAHSNSKMSSRKSMEELRSMYAREEDKWLLQQIVREVNRRRRSELLLRTSRSPVSERRFVVDSYRPSFQPKVNESVPDFDAAYRRFLQTSEDFRCANEPTRCRPFALHTDARVRQRIVLKQYEKELKQKLDDEMTRRMTTRAGCLKLFYREDIPAVLYNKTVELRLCKNRDEANKRRVLELEARRRKVEEEKRKMGLRRQLPSNDTSSERNYVGDDTYGKQRLWKEKSLQLKREQLSRERQYRQDLDNIRCRVRERATLAQQERQFSARMSAEKQFKRTLSEAGVSLEVKGVED